MATVINYFLCKKIKPPFYSIQNVHACISKIISVIVEKICHSFMAMSRLFGVLSFKNAVMNDALMTLVTLFSGSSVTFEVNRQ